MEYSTTEPQFHDTQNIVMQKINQFYCADATVTPPDEPPDVTIGLLAYWAMEEGTGAIARQDSHTGNYDLSPLFGSPLAQDTGIISFGTKLFGTSGLIMGNSDAVFALTGQMTLTGWVKFNAVTANSFLLGKQDVAPPLPSADTPSEGYMLYINPLGALAFFVGNGTSTQQIVSIVPTTNTWYFVSCGSNGSEIFMQINAATRNYGPGLTPTVGSQGLEFGSTHGALIGPDAIFDEWGVWNRVLSLEEIDYLYNSGAGRTYPFV